eukprot:UN04334
MLSMLSRPSLVAHFFVSYQLAMFASFEKWSSIGTLIDAYGVSDSVVAVVGAVGIVIENISNVCNSNDKTYDLIKLMFLTQFVCDYISQRHSLSLAALMIFGSDILSHYLQNTNLSQLQVDLADRTQSWPANVEFDLIKMANILNKWQFNVSNQGKVFSQNYFASLFERNMDLIQGELGDTFFIAGKISMRYKQYNDSLFFFTMVSPRNSTLYIVITSL